MKKFKNCYFLCFLLCLSVLFSAQDTLAEGFAEMKEKSLESKSFELVTVRNFFSCEVPANWLKDVDYFGLSQDEKKVYGFSLTGPHYGDIPIRISAYYYAKGNLMYKSIERYIRAFSQPVLGVALEGSSDDKITTLMLSGKEVKMFERIKNEYVPFSNIIRPSDEPAKNDPRVYERREMKARAVPVKERFVVIPAESGFYALRYTAPADKYQEFLPIFEKVTASFIAIQ